MTAKIKLNAASGGGSFSLQAPSSSANNRVITLPDVADGTVLTTTNPKSGNIIQVVSTTKVDQFSTASTSFVDVTGLSVDMTATSASNKILITVDVFASCEDAAVLRLLVDSTLIGNGTGGASANERGFAMVRQDDGNLGSGYGIQFLHTPSDTNSHTYKVVGRATSASHSLGINRRADDTNYSLSSSITVMEVAA